MTGIAESLEKAVVKLYRKRLSKRLYQNSSKVVGRGPFEGMKLVEFSHLSSGPLALKLFGLYEQEVAGFLSSLKGRDTLVNLGAGDGYYSIGLILNGAVKRSVCFELDDEGRKAIAENASAHDMGDAIRIFGPADADLAAKLAQEEVKGENTILLCDIEGAEFTVITSDLISQLAKAVFVVELHPFAVEGGDAALVDLEKRFSDTHTVERIAEKPRDWTGIAELEALGDNERALVMSDGRKALGIWLVATPKSG